MNKLLNLTPHSVRIYDPQGETVIVDLPPAGPAVRVQSAVQEPLGVLRLGDATIPLATPQRFTAQVSGLPERGERGYPAILVGIVGAEQVQAAYLGPVFVTDTGPASVVRVKDGPDNGAVLGMRRLNPIGGWWVVGDRHLSPAIMQRLWAVSAEQALARARAADPTYAEAIQYAEPAGDWDL